MAFVTDEQTQSQEVAWFRHDPYQGVQDGAVDAVEDRGSLNNTMSSSDFYCPSEGSSGNSVRRASDPPPLMSPPTRVMSPPAVRSPSNITTTSCPDSHSPSADLSGNGGSIRTSEGDGVLAVVQFKWGRLGDFRCTLPLNVGTAVLVETDSGMDLGIVHSIDRQSNPPDVEWRIIRAASRKEQDKWKKQLVVRETAAKKKAQKVLDDAGLALRIHHAEYQFDKKKVTLHYTSDEARPNFRGVLDDLFAIFRCRVWFSRYSGKALERDRANGEHSRRTRKSPERRGSDDSTGTATSEWSMSSTLSTMVGPGR